MASPERKTGQTTSFNRFDSYWSNRLRNALKVFSTDIRATWRRTEAHDLPILASSLSFFCLFSVFPFLILCFFGTHLLLGEAAMPQREVAAFFETLVPNIAPWIAQSLFEVVRRNLVTDLVNLLLLLLSAYGLFTCLHTIFARLSPRHEKRGLILSNVVAMACFTIAALSMSLLVLLLTTRAENLRQLLSSYLPDLSVQVVATTVPVIAFAAAVLTITIVYKLLPLQPVRWVAAFRGSVMFLSLFWLGRTFYQSYVKCYAIFNEATYGNFFTLVVVFVWMYYLCSCFIFAASYALCLTEKPPRRKRALATAA